MISLKPEKFTLTMEPYSKMKLRAKSVPKKDAQVQTLNLKHPSEIRLPSYSAYESLFINKPTFVQSIETNQHKAENEALKLKNKRHLEKIDELTLEKERMQRKLKELEIAYELTRSGKSKANYQLLKEAKEKSNELIKKIEFAEVALQNIDKFEENSNILIHKDKNAELAYLNEIKAFKENRVLDGQMEAMIKEELQLIIKLKEMKIDELAREAQKLTTNNHFLARQAEEVVQVKLDCKGLSEELEAKKDNIKFLKREIASHLQEKHESQKQINLLKREIEEFKARNEEYASEMKSFAQALEDKETQIKDILKDFEGTNRIEGESEFLKEAISYLFHLAKKMESKYNRDSVKWSKEKKELEKEMALREKSQNHEDIRAKRKKLTLNKL